MSVTVPFSRSSMLTATIPEPLGVSCWSPRATNTCCDPSIRDWSRLITCSASWPAVSSHWITWNQSRKPQLSLFLLVVKYYLRQDTIMGYFASLIFFFQTSGNKKYTFKCLFNCTLSICVFRFKLQYIYLKAVFSQLVFYVLSQLNMYTKTFQFYSYLLYILKDFTKGFVFIICLI